ncbi:MAG: thiolase domain-containing protein [Candidatus Levybacteria bacterium]|nr:thiolase domain-containing protein [Candidatus Levybacteria bacterium]
MKISIIGAATTKFGELWNSSPRELAKEAFSSAITQANVDAKKIEALYVGNMLGGLLGHQENIGSFYAEELGLAPVPAFRLEAACASGGVALHNAINSIKAGLYKTVAVLGIEKMTDAGGDLVASALMAAGSDEERGSGITFPGLYALMAQAYMAQYKISEQDLAEVAVKNHYHGSFNHKAQFRFPVTVSDVMKSSRIADPLKLLDCSPVTDGGACLIITSDGALMSKKGVSIVASEVGTDTLALHKRSSFTSLRAAKEAAKRAYAKAGVSAEDIDVAEVHDCFSIAELIALEDLGFSEVGKAAGDVKKGKFTRGKGRTIVNPSGGLKACGHPVGATGIKQAIEIYEQLMGTARDKQSVKNAKIGLAHNVGGSGAIATVHIFRRI